MLSAAAPAACASAAAGSAGNRRPSCLVFGGSNTTEDQAGEATASILRVVCCCSFCLPFCWWPQVKPRFLLLCHRPGDFFQLSPDALRAPPFLDQAPHHTARQLLHSQGEASPLGQRQAGAVEDAPRGDELPLGQAHRRLVQDEGQGGVGLENEGGGRASRGFQVDAHALVAAWEGVQGRLQQRGGPGAHPEAGAPPPPVATLSGEEGQKVDPSVAAALAAAAALRVKRENTCTMRKVWSVEASAGERCRLPESDADMYAIQFDMHQFGRTGAYQTVLYTMGAQLQQSCY